MAGKRLSDSKTSFMAALFGAAAFMLLGIVCYGVFKERCLPVDENMPPERWARQFLLLFAFSSGASLLLNWIVTFVIALRELYPSRASWWTLLMLSILIGVSFSVFWILFYPEEIGWYILAVALFIAEHGLIYFLATNFSSEIWRNGFFPFAGVLRRGGRKGRLS
ncbi:MAG: hypothetical protein LBT44_09105 [Clostridiales bacterium]|jgi:hypothetical protein|nr:hypothetical protein [Clostridiales bacterium]